MSDITELARRAVACPHWRWMDGMFTACRVRVTEGGANYLIGDRCGSTRDGGGWVDTGDVSGFLPDLTDPATLGCLLALVREVWGQPRLHARPDGHWWRMHADEPAAFVYASESEALVCALEAAPC